MYNKINHTVHLFPSLFILGQNDFKLQLDPVLIKTISLRFALHSFAISNFRTPAILNYFSLSLRGQNSEVQLLSVVSFSSRGKEESETNNLLDQQI